MRNWTLAPAGDGASEIGLVWWIIFSICAVAFVLTFAAVLWAVLRRRGGIAGLAARPELRPDPAGERRLTGVVGTLVGVVAAILFGLSLLSYGVSARLFANPGSDALDIEVVGHQWWWEVTYHDKVPSRTIVTANEIHLPKDRAAKLTLRSDDVIHSFFVPVLNGKMDLIPGQKNTLWLTPRETGAFHGQCAEFCGLQHAFMRLLVVVEEPNAFEAWAGRQRRPAEEPHEPLAKRGKDVFMTGPCVMCHAIQGTSAGAVTGPNLTHVASRRTIGAGRFPNTRGHLAGWIVDAPTQKPGVRMPTMALPPDDLQALLAYLETLR
jgi:cytochrome c oxidase subunit 2